MTLRLGMNLNIGSRRRGGGASLGPAFAVALDGTGDYVTTGDVGKITGDFDLIVCAALNNWSAATQGIVSKNVTTGNKRQWALAMTGGTGKVYLSTDGTATATETTASLVAAASPAGGSYLWLKIAGRFSGASLSLSHSYSAEHPSKPYGSVSWTEWDTGTQAIAGLYNGDAPVVIGSRYNTFELMTGKVAFATMLDAAGDPTMWFDPRDWVSGSTWVSSGPQAETYTLNGDASVAEVPA